MNVCVVYVDIHSTGGLNAQRVHAQSVMMGRRGVSDGVI